MRRLALLLIALLAVAAAGSACGGDGDEDAPSTAEGAAVEGTQRSGAAGAAQGQQAGGAGQASGGSRETGGPSFDAGEAGGSSDEKGATHRVDLRVRPKSIRRARVTPTGAVQTLPPSEKAHEVAETNGYSSINSFGSESTGAEATEITFALVQYLAARAEGDWPTACARIYSVLRERLEQGRGCAEAFGTLMSRVPVESRLEQAKVDVAGVRRGADDRAFVIYKTPKTLSVDMPMYLEDGVWKVGSLEAYALTPDQLP